MGYGLSQGSKHDKVRGQNTTGEGSKHDGGGQNTTPGWSKHDHGGAKTRSGRGQNTTHPAKKQLFRTVLWITQGSEHDAGGQNTMHRWSEHDHQGVKTRWLARMVGGQNTILQGDPKGSKHDQARLTSTTVESASLNFQVKRKPTLTSESSAARRLLRNSPGVASEPHSSCR